jgi:hypothetical protein
MILELRDLAHAENVYPHRSGETERAGISPGLLPASDQGLINLDQSDELVALRLGQS